MKKIKEIYKNKWVRFSVMSVLWILIFTIWTGCWYSIFFVAFIYDYYISNIYKKLFWNKYTAIKDKYKSFKFVMGWIEAIVFGLIVAGFLRGYFVEMYVIPSPSMESTLMVGDYIGVNKVSYGPKLSNTPISIPLVHNVNPINPEKKSYLEWVKRPYKRLAGLSSVKNGDVIVFNYPQGDTVLLVSPQQNYYELERVYGKKYIEENISKIITHPVDKRDNYIKRAVAISGDLFEIKDGNVYINNEKEKELKTRQDLYSVQFNPGAITRAFLEKNNIPDLNIISFHQNSMLAFLTEKQANVLENAPKIQNCVRVSNKKPNINVFPYDTVRYKFNEHNFGPIQIPKKGVSINVNIDNLPLYERLINVYEQNELTVKENGDIYINGKKTDTYTFKMDYYFAMGDNRDNSLDSRFFGFIPEDHLVGKASFIWFSVDNSKKFPSNIRFDRMFKSIK